MSLDDGVIASFIESFDERARRSNARYSDEDDELTFSSLGLDRFAVSEILRIKNNIPRAPPLNEDYLPLDDLSEDALRRLGYIFSGNTTMDSITVYRQLSGPEAEDAWLYAGIRRNRSLTKLSVRRLYTPIHLGILDEFLLNNTNLTELKLASCRLRSTDIHILGDTLMQRTTNYDTLAELDLSDNFFRDDDMGTLIDAVKRSKALKRLILSENVINGKAIPSLAVLLSSSESELEELDLSSNSICAEDALMLIESLEGNSKLKTLNLGRNESITDEGWASIAKRVSRLVYNASSITKVAQSNHALSSLGPPYNTCRDDFGVQFDQYLERDEASLVRASLGLNFSYGPERQSIKARRKVFWGQIRGDFQVGDESIDIGLMPRVIALVGFVHPCVPHCISCCKESTKLLQYPPEERPGQLPPLHHVPRPMSTTRLETVYNIVRARPELCCEKHNIEEKLRAELAVSQAKNQRQEEEIKRLKCQLTACRGK